MPKKSNRKKADEFADDLKPLLQKLIEQGYGLGRIQDYLNNHAHPTRFRQRWHRTQVKRVLKRLGLRTLKQAALDSAYQGRLDALDALDAKYKAEMETRARKRPRLVRRS